jgi:heme a synthase
MIWLHRYTKLVAASTVLLIAAGGMVTSTGSGLSVPDWPNTYGWFMFSFPVNKWVGGIRYEHSHRLIASTVGFLTIILAVWTWRVDRRPWVRTLGFAALGAVVLQGLLGGITVLLKLPPPVSIGHAGLAQLFFCITLSLAVFTSPSWLAGYRRGSAADGPPPDDRSLRLLATATTLMVYAQILLGATMRHTNAGMAIPTFPLAFGHVLPPAWTSAIAIHFAHRVGALLVTIAILATTVHVRTRHGSRRELVRPAMLLVALVAVQIMLGAFVVWSALQPIVNTIHVVNGALVLGTSLVLTLRTYHTRMVTAGARVPRNGAPRFAGGSSPVTSGLRTDGQAGLSSASARSAVGKGSAA